MMKLDPDQQWYSNNYWRIIRHSNHFSRAPSDWVQTIKTENSAITLFTNPGDDLMWLVEVNQLHRQLAGFFIRRSLWMSRLETWWYGLSALGVWWRSWICLVMLWPYANIISNYNKDQPVNSSQRCTILYKDEKCATRLASLFFFLRTSSWVVSLKFAPYWIHRSFRQISEFQAWPVVYFRHSSSQPHIPFLSMVGFFICKSLLRVFVWSYLEAP